MKELKVKLHLYMEFDETEETPEEAENRFYDTLNATGLDYVIHEQIIANVE